MSIASLFSDLAQQGIQLEADGERLRYYPRSALTPGLLARLKAHKAALVAILTARDPQATLLWPSALDLLAGDPQFPPNKLAGLRKAEAIWVRDSAEEQTQTLTKTDSPIPGHSGESVNVNAVRCGRCGSSGFRDIPIHQGRSTRRDCQRCGHTAGFPVWDPPSDGQRRKGQP